MDHNNLLFKKHSKRTINKMAHYQHNQTQYLKNTRATLGNK